MTTKRTPPRERVFPVEVANRVCRGIVLVLRQQLAEFETAQRQPEPTPEPIAPTRKAS